MAPTTRSGAVDLAQQAIKCMDSGNDEKSLKTPGSDMAYLEKQQRVTENTRIGEKKQ